MKRVAFKIRGMNCAEEVAVLQRELGPLVGGEANLAFDILNGKMTVLMAEETCSEAVIRRAVARTGMAAIPWQESGATPRGEERFWHRHGRTILCSASGILLSAGFLWHALRHGSLLEALAPPEAQVSEGTLVGEESRGRMVEHMHGMMGGMMGRVPMMEHMMRPRPMRSK